MPAVLATVGVAGLEALYMFGDLRAPASGAVIAGWLIGLISVGYIGKGLGWRLPLLVLAAVLVVPILDHALSGAGWNGVWSVPQSEACDPTCGIPLADSIAFLAYVALALTLVGWAVRWVTLRSWRHTSKPAEDRAP